MPSPLRRNGAASWGGCGCPVDTSRSEATTEPAGEKAVRQSALTEGVDRLGAEGKVVLCCQRCAAAGFSTSSVTRFLRCCLTANRVGACHLPRQRGRQGSFGLFSNVNLNVKIQQKASFKWKQKKQKALALPEGGEVAGRRWRPATLGPKQHNRPPLRKSGCVLERKRK